MLNQDIEEEKQLSKIDDKNRETNPYKDSIVNNAEKIEPLMTQMEHWSTLSNVLNYVQDSRFNSMNHTLDVKAMNKYKSKPNTEREFKELDFGTTPLKLQEEYMDVYEGIQSEIGSSNRFDVNSDISATYLGRVENKYNQNKLKVEESFPISENGYTLGRLLDGTECQLFLDTGASKSFMSKSFYMQCKSLQTLPKYASKTQRIQIGNGQCVSVLFILPVIVDIHGHKLFFQNPEELGDLINKENLVHKFLPKQILTKF